jgi:hypothetical protein
MSNPPHDPLIRFRPSGPTYSTPQDRVSWHCRADDPATTAVARYTLLDLSYDRTASTDPDHLGAPEAMETTDRRTTPTRLHHRRPQISRPSTRPSADRPRQRPHRLPRCPRRSGEVPNRRTGVLTPRQCRSTRCPYCIVGRALGVADALGQAQISWAATVTDVGPSWPVIRDGFKLFNQRLRRLDVDYQLAYNVEPSRAGADNHAHLWVRSPALTITELRLASKSAGFGSHVHLERGYVKITGSGRAYIDYGLKMILDYGATHPTRLWPTAADYLDRNGGRLVHNTRDFWLDKAGNRCTLADAVRSSRHPRSAHTRAHA